jgi:hypothetical protein
MTIMMQVMIYSYWVNKFAPTSSHYSSKIAWRTTSQHWLLDVQFGEDAHRTG